MKKKEIIQKIEQEAKSFFIGASGCHDWTHVDRVRNLALHIGKIEKANLFVLEIAALLHDIARKEEMKSRGGFCHADEGAKMSRKILKKFNIKNNDIENIVHCIETHRWRKNNLPETLEAKIIFDTDKLDSIGAVGVARGFLFAGNAGSNCLYTGNENRLAKTNEDYSFGKEDSALLEYEIKLKYIKDKILTNEGKKIAKERHRYMTDFFKRFKEEVKGFL